MFSQSVELINQTFFWPYYFLMTSIIRIKGILAWGFYKRNDVAVLKIILGQKL